MRGCTSLGQLEDGVRSGVMAEIRSAQKATGHNPTGVALAGLLEGAARSGERARRGPVRGKSWSLRRNDREFTYPECRV